MSVSLAVVGALSGAMVCGIAGVAGAKAAFRQTTNPAQRQTLRQVFTWGGAYVTAVMGIVILTAFEVLPHWSYAAATVLWFGPMLPALSWAHQQLEAATEQRQLLDASLSAA